MDQRNLNKCKTGEKSDKTNPPLTNRLSRTEEAVSGQPLHLNTYTYYLLPISPALPHCSILGEFFISLHQFPLLFQREISQKIYVLREDVESISRSDNIQSFIKHFLVVKLFSHFILGRPQNDPLYNYHPANSKPWSYCAFIFLYLHKSNPGPDQH